ncbi:hypothetical protein H70357_19470 [Paenibacillus sp. FSL H7-0357]|uniref:DUF6773 family protein n=1 Tax=Paenibacillus sp. FSL H7-0357 TaxID=1536774 RepID=UPI0004F69123|nr:DUF6773 family protein [Paenibacillus sp. FSL H7-0357]AIQ18636.1 hypothetical protein H70357_19470 [Paenibacillus sp. FSL H7-0357]
MKGKGIKDERIQGEVHKLMSHGFTIVFVGITASVFVKVFVLHLDLKYWLDSFLILMAACFYVTLRSMRGGLFLLPSKAGEVKRLKKTNLISGAAGALIWAILMISYDLLGKEEVDVVASVMSTLVGSVIFFFGITWMQWFMIKRSNQNADKHLE